MSSQDNEQLSNIPRIVPDRDDVASYQRQKQGKTKPAAERSPEPQDEGGNGTTGGGISLPIFALVTVALLGWAGYLHWQLTQAQVRVGNLEQRLSMTDESLNQSGVAMQVKIKEIDTALGQLRDDTIKAQKAQLDRQGGLLTALDKSMKTAQASLTKVDQRGTDQQKTLDGVREQLDKVAPTVELTKRKLEEQQASLEAANDKINRAVAQQGKLESRIGSNEEWVQSINTFRVQTNRELVSIKQQLNTGKTAPAEPTQ